MVFKEGEAVLTICICAREVVQRVRFLLCTWLNLIASMTYGPLHTNPGVTPLTLLGMAPKLKPSKKPSKISGHE